jgi:O-antigen ligase
MKTIRVGICFLLAFAVLAHGAVEVWSESILELGAALLFVFWGIRTFLDPPKEIRWNVLNWPLLALIAFGLAQLALGWTVYAYLTRSELLRLITYFLLFFLAAQVFRERVQLRAFAWFLLFLGFAVGLFAIIQFFTFNGKLYWFRELLEGGLPFGPFVNRNHFAGFMELILPVGLALLVFRGVRRDLVPLAGLFTIVQVGALFLSASRGGIVSFGFELAVLVVMVWVLRAGRLRLGAVAMVMLAAVTLVAWLGIGQVIERFSQIRPGEVSLSRRVAMFKDTWRIFLDHRGTGIGLGTLVVAYPQYETTFDGKIVEHAHNDYVEALAETGLPGALCGLAFLFLLFREALSRLEEKQSPFSLALHAGGLVACAGLLVHSFVDFNLHIPSNALLFLLQAFLATSATLAPEEPRRVRSTARRISVVDSKMPSSP